ncbi:MAG: tandem-95 repeat protein, partial [Acidimicrobiia bacterium]|nr:tandem-95 repeat protein [Acidimicrobiia bacterium]NNL69498.1 tandem-95 repeat protein [Acidimicrobiia bacterium]
TPDPGFSGTDSLVYEVCGIGGGCDTAVLAITVSAVNDPPGLGGVPATVEEDSSVVINVIAHVTDPDGDADQATVTLAGIAAEGLVLANGDGTFTYTPPPNYSGSDSFTVQVCDTGGLCLLHSIPVTVQSVNDAPVVSIVRPAAVEDTPVSIFVDAVDADGDTLSTSIIAGPSAGTAVVDEDGSIFYTPDPDFFGAESLTVEVCDPFVCTGKSVSFTVAAVNDPPVVPGPGPLTTPEETMISFDPLAGATDPEGGALTLNSFDAVSAAGGSIAEGSLEYTPPPDFTGADSFEYTVSDPGGATASVTVSVTVTALNDDPVAQPDAYAMLEDGVLTITAPGVLGNDSDVDGDDLAAAVNAAPAKGVVTVNADGSFTYTPNANYAGSDSFTYTATDGFGGSATATVDIEIGPVNDAPVAKDDAASTSGPGAISIPVLSNDMDPESGIDASTLSLVVPPSKGAAVVKPGGTVDYTPSSGETGTDSFVYEICDTGGLCDTATVTVGLMGPVAVDDSAPMAEDDPPITINAVANDTDPNADLDPSSAVVQAPATNGVATANGDGTFDYDSNPNFAGVDSFDYRVCDLTGACNTATVTITVTAVNDAPVATDDAPSVAEDNPSGVTFNVLANDTDVDLDPLTIDSFDTSGIVNGSLVDNGAGSFTYVPDPQFFGVESFTYVVTDGVATDGGTVTITVSNVPDTPIAADDAYATNQDVPIVAAAPGVLGNDSDYDGDPLTAGLDNPPANGGVVLNGDGSFTYTPDPGFTGTDSFTYTAFDGTLLSAPATVTITVDSGISGLAWYFGDTGSTPDDYDFVPAPPSPGLADPDGDSNPGLTVRASNGSEAEADPAKYHNWILDPGAAPLEINGPVVLKLWSTVANYELGTDVDLTVRLYDCDAVALGSCTPALLTYDVHTDNWNGGVADFSYREVTVGSLTHTLVPGRVLKLRLQFDHEDVWVDMNATHPTELELTLANVPPAAVDDNYPLVPPMLEDGPLVNLDVLANDFDADLDPSSLALEPFPVPVGTVVLKGDNTFDYTPAGDFAGVDTFDYRVCDTTPVCSIATVTVTLTAVNDAPVFTKGADQVVLEDSGRTDVPGWATGIDEGGGVDEDTQTVSFTIAGAPGDLAQFDTLEIRDDGELRVEPAGDVFGTFNFTAVAMDDGGTANGGVDTSPGQAFTVTVTPVNDEPDFSDGPDVTVDEDAGAQTFPGWATGITAGVPNEEPPVQALTFAIMANDNVPLFAVAPVVDPTTGDLTFTAAADVSGTANIQLRLSDDGGTLNGGIDTSATRPFKITVDAVNDAPSFTKGPDQTVLPDSGAHAIVGWATGISPGPADESGQSVAFNTTGNTNPALFSAPPLVASTGTLGFTVAPGQTGTATITIEAQDDGGTVNGGDDTSPSHTFTITVLTPAIVVSEFRPDGPLGALDEFVEIFNAGTTAVDMTGWKLHVTSGVDVDFYTFPAFTLNPGQHYLVANTSVAAGLGADGVISGVLFGPAFGDVQILTPTGAEIDAFHYGAGPTVGEGAALPAWVTTGADGSFERRAGLTFGNCVDSDANRSDFVRRHGLSTPQNSAMPVTPCATPATATTLVISEFRTTGPAGFEDEFIEVFNPTGAAADISGWQLVETGTGVLHTYQIGTIVPSGGRYVVAPGSGYPGFKDDTYNGVVGFPYLVQFAGHLELRTDTAAVVDAVAWGGGAAEGTPLPDYGPFAPYDRSYDRGFNGCADIDSNFADFIVSWQASPGTGIC